MVLHSFKIPIRPLPLDSTVPGCSNGQALKFHLESRPSTPGLLKLEIVNQANGQATVNFADIAQPILHRGMASATG